MGIVIIYKSNMRGSGERQRQQSKIAREADHIMKKIEQIKEEMSPVEGQKFTSAHRERWSQYLPTENNMGFGSVSRKEERGEQYRHSLEQRLEKLFREEKELLKDRHFTNSSLHSQVRPRESQSKVPEIIIRGIV